MEIVKHNNRNYTAVTSSSRLVECAPKKVRPYLELLRLDQPFGFLLVFWPFGWSVALAASPGNLPNLYYLTLFIIIAVVMRGIGCTINDMLDRDIDEKVKRTRNRPLVNGAINIKQAWTFLFGQLSLLLFIILRLNWYSIVLTVCSLGSVTFYPLMKRYTYWPQLGLGLTLNWGVLIAYSAIDGYRNIFLSIPLYLAGTFWTVIYDTIYAHQDRQDDLRIGIKSTAILFSSSTRKWLIAFTFIVTGNLVLLGIINEQLWPYYLSVAFIFVYILRTLITLDTNNVSDCTSKFLKNTRIGFFLFCGIILSNLLKK